MRKIFCFAFALILCLFAGCKAEKPDTDIPSDKAAKENVAVETLSFKVNDSMPEYVCAYRYDDPEYPSRVTIEISAEDTGETIQTIESEYNSVSVRAVSFADINFDGNKDMIIPINNPASAIYCEAYVWGQEHEEFVHADGFDNIPNFVIDQENERILGCRTASRITSFVIYRYNENGNNFIITNSVYYEPTSSDDAFIFVEEKLGENMKYTVVAEFEAAAADAITIDKNDEKVKPYFKDGSFWDLDGDKWQDCYFLERN